MTEEKAKKNLDKCQAELEKIEAKKGELSQSVAALQAERSAAVRRLAGGDSEQRKVILGLEAEIAPLSLDLEGLESLIAESTAAVAKAEDDLKTAMAEENARLQAFIAEREKQEKEKFIASLPEREQKIVNLHQALCQELAEIQIEKFRYAKDGDLSHNLEELLMLLPAKVHESISARGLRPLLTAGHAERFVVHPLVDPGPELSAAFPGRGPLLGPDVALVRKEKRTQEFLAEYRSKKHGG